MSQIQIRQLTFSYEEAYDLIFDHVSFDLDTDWKLGLIGRNGKGKTTFLKLLMGEYPYQGQILSNVTFEYVPYHVSNMKETTLEVMKGAVAPFREWEKRMEQCVVLQTEEAMDEYGRIAQLYEQHDGYVIEERIQAELSKLMVTLDVLRRPFETLSHGERTKVLLAALFLKKNTFLLIDEPTNHLDAAARELLASYLNTKRGFILVSHDRTLLNICVDHVLSVNRNSLTVLKGNYNTWKEQKDLEDQHELSQNVKLKREIASLQEAKMRTLGWSDQTESSKIGAHVYDRGFVGHKAAKMMKRAKALERRQDKNIEEKEGLLQDIETVCDLKMNVLTHDKKTLLRVSDLAIAYPAYAGEPARMICEGVSFCIHQGERILLEGPNGCGKSSVVKAVLGSLLPAKGSIDKAFGLIISYVSQDTSFLKGSLMEFAEAGGINYSIFLTVLQQLDFPRQQFEKEMQYYSEGQKKKVLLARSLSEPAHLFVWDEPLNYIDVFSRTQIEAVIKAYQAPMLLIEHDRTFVDAVDAVRVSLTQS